MASRLGLAMREAEVDWRGSWESREGGRGRRETENENIRNSRLIRMSRFSQGGRA